VDATLHVLSYHHKNIDICGTIFKILSACAFEEKHVTFILTQQIKEFQFMCQSISMFQTRGDIDVIESILIIIKRCVHSDCMTELHKRVRGDIQGLVLHSSPSLVSTISHHMRSVDAIRSTLTHRPDCTDQEACVLSTSCNISENHISLCTSIINALSALQVGLHSDDQGDIEEVSASLTESGDEDESDEKSDKHPTEVAVVERVTSPSINIAEEVSRDTGPRRRGSETLPNEQSFLKRKEGKSLIIDCSLLPLPSFLHGPHSFFLSSHSLSPPEHQTQVIKILQQEIQDWKKKYEELKILYEQLLQQQQQQRDHIEESGSGTADGKGLRNESVTFHTTVQNKSQTSDASISTPEPTAPWSPIHMEEEYEEFHELDGKNQGPSHENHGEGDSNPPHHDDLIGSFSTFDVNDIDSNINYFPDHPTLEEIPQPSHPPPPPLSIDGDQEDLKGDLDLIFQEIPKEDSVKISIGMRNALEFISQSQIKFIQKLHASLSVLQIPMTHPSPHPPQLKLSKHGHHHNLLELYPLEPSLEKVPSS
jgi:hypothetical protein